MIKISNYQPGHCNFHKSGEEEWDSDNRRIAIRVRTITYNSTDSQSFSFQICDKCSDDLITMLEEKDE